MPTECAHGRCIDWGDFGPADEWGQSCDECGIPAQPRCGRCEGQGVTYRYTSEGNPSGWLIDEDPCSACGGVPIEDTP